MGRGEKPVPEPGARGGPDGRGEGMAGRGDAGCTDGTAGTSAPGAMGAVGALGAGRAVGAGTGALAAGGSGVGAAAVGLGVGLGLGTGGCVGDTLPGVVAAGRRMTSTAGAIRRGFPIVHGVTLPDSHGWGEHKGSWLERIR